jgi:hypothetical protein
MKLIRRLTAAIIVCAFGAVLFPCTLSAAAVISYALPTSGDPRFYATSPETEGSFFQANGSVWVTALGVWDSPFSYGQLTGPRTAHEVALWTAGGSLLGSATIPAGNSSPLLDGYRWATLDTPILLTAGQTYVLGASYPVNTQGVSPDVFRPSAPIDPNFTLLGWCTGGITPLNGAVFPTQYGPADFQTEGGLQGWFGPNLQAVVPEPSALIIVPIALLTIWRLRRAKNEPDAC